MERKRRKYKSDEEAKEARRIKMIGYMKKYNAKSEAKAKKKIYNKEYALRRFK